VGRRAGRGVLLAVGGNAVSEPGAVREPARADLQGARADPLFPAESSSRAGGAHGSQCSPFASGPPAGRPRPRCGNPPLEKLGEKGRTTRSLRSLASGEPPRSLRSLGGCWHGKSIIRTERSFEGPVRARRRVCERNSSAARGVETAEGSKPPSVRPGIRLSVRARVRATIPRGLAPVRIRRSIRSPRSALGGSTPPRFGGCLARGSRTSSVEWSGLVSVPAPAVSRSGFAPGHLPGRWGDFPHVSDPMGCRDTEAGLPLPVDRSGHRGLSPSVRAPASPDSAAIFMSATPCFR